MRFLTWASFVLAASGSAASASSLPSVRCLDLGKFIESVPAERIAAMAHSQVCQTDCKIKPSDHYSAFRDFATQFIAEETKAMGAPHLQKSYLNMFDLGFEMARDECGFDNISSDSVCQDPSQFAAFGKCAQSKFWRVLLTNPGTVMPLLVQDNCETQLNYFQSPQFLDEKFPRFFKEYADFCTSLN
ncbi:hypothetical protein BDW62DRAFT_195408 [Aspergillus aurantiobrunneus]